MTERARSTVSRISLITYSIISLAGSGGKYGCAGCDGEILGMREIDRHLGRNIYNNGFTLSRKLRKTVDHVIR